MKIPEGRDKRSKRANEDSNYQMMESGGAKGLSAERSVRKERGPHDDLKRRAKPRIGKRG